MCCRQESSYLETMKQQHDVFEECFSHFFFFLLNLLAFINVDVAGNYLISVDSNGPPLLSTVLVLRWQNYGERSCNDNVDSPDLYLSLFE